MFKCAYAESEASDMVFSGAWEPCMSIRAFVHEVMDRRKDKGNDWILLTESASTLIQVVQYLRDSPEPQLPDLNSTIDDHMISFNNAQYDIRRNAIYPHWCTCESNESCSCGHESHNNCSSRFVDTWFDCPTQPARDEWVPLCAVCAMPRDACTRLHAGAHAFKVPRMCVVCKKDGDAHQDCSLLKEREGTDRGRARWSCQKECSAPPVVAAPRMDWWFDLIPTPSFETILRFQGLSDEMIRWTYVLLGRLMYRLREHDDVQASLTIIGVAGCGKSVIGDTGARVRVPRRLPICFQLAACLPAVKLFFSDDNVAIISSNSSQQFGRS